MKYVIPRGKTDINILPKRKSSHYRTICFLILNQILSPSDLEKDDHENIVPSGMVFQSILQPLIDIKNIRINEEEHRNEKEKGFCKGFAISKENYGLRVRSSSCCSCRRARSISCRSTRRTLLPRKAVPRAPL